MRQFLLVIALIMVAGCGQPSYPDDDVGKAPENGNKSVVSAVELGRLRDEVTELKRELAVAKRRDKPATVASASQSVPAFAPASATPTHASSMCYKDYCPCSKPQEGMDSIICDQLEAGIDVPTETMIAGRGGREYRRQAAELGF